MRACTRWISKFHSSCLILVLGAGFSCLAIGATRPPDPSIGPTNQLLTNPYVNNGADPQNQSKLGTNSVVQVQTPATVGTGTVIKSQVIGGSGYFCVLTADHVLNGSVANQDSIAFNNSPAEGQTAGPRFPVVMYARVAGDVGETVDMAVALVKIGDPTQAVFTQTMIRGIAATSVGADRLGTEIGFGRRTGNGDNNTTNPLIGVNGTYGIKRYQNQKTTRTINNFARNYSAVNYAYHSLTYTFDAIGAANRVNGEGFGFAGDSGAPLFVDFEVNSTNLNAQNYSVYTNTIAGVDVFGPNDTSQNPGAPLNVSEEATVDAGYYNAQIAATCNALLASAVPALSPLGAAVLTIILLAVGSFGLRRQSLQRRLT